MDSGRCRQPEDHACTHTYNTRTVRVYNRAFASPKLRYIMFARGAAAKSSTSHYVHIVRSRALLRLVCSSLAIIVNTDSHSLVSSARGGSPSVNYRARERCCSDKLPRARAVDTTRRWQLNVIMRDSIAVCSRVSFSVSLAAGSRFWYLIYSINLISLFSLPRDNYYGGDGGKSWLIAPADLIQGLLFESFQCRANVGRTWCMMSACKKRNEMRWVL